MLMKRNVLTVFGLLASSLLAPPVLGAERPEVPEDVDTKALRSAQESFKRAFDTADIDFKLQALARFAKVQHREVAKTLLKHLKSKDKHVRAGAALGLGHQQSSSRSAGSKLVKLATENGEEPKVVKAAVSSIASLWYQKADKDLKNLIHHKEDVVVAQVFRAYGHWKSDLALREMLDFFKRFPDEKSFATGSVTVDTGAAGTKDQKAAQAKWKAKYGGQRNWRPRPECIKALQWALKEITGYGFRRPEDLERYLNLKDPSKYRDPEKILETLPETNQRQLYKDWYRFKDTAAERALKKMPGEDEETGKERAKIWRKYLNELRDDLIEREKLILSELDVIVEEGDERGWPKKS